VPGGGRALGRGLRVDFFGAADSGVGGRLLALAVDEDASEALVDFDFNPASSVLISRLQASSSLSELELSVWRRTQGASELLSECDRDVE
jgi:hypothetical protein